MQNALLKFRPMSLLATAAALTLSLTSHATAQQPSAAGLWQKIENSKPVVWILFVNHNGVFEGIIAKDFPEPGETPNLVCSKCTDDRKDAPVLGLSFIRDMKRNGLKYLSGNVLDPRDGSVYGVTMRVSADGQTLTLRSHLGISLLGRDETWYRLPDANVAQFDPGIVAKYLPTQIGATKPLAVPRRNASPAR
jgi:hypothetical protein